MEYRQTHVRPESLAGGESSFDNALTQVGKSFKFVNHTCVDVYVGYAEGLVNKVRGDRLNTGTELNIVVEYLTGNPRFFDWDRMDDFDVRLSEDTIKALKDAARSNFNNGFNTGHSGIFSNRVVLYYQIKVSDVIHSRSGIYVSDLNLLLFGDRHRPEFPEIIHVQKQDMRDYFRDIELGASILFYCENKDARPLYTVFGTDLISITPITDGLRPAGVYIRTCDEISFVSVTGKERKEKHIPYNDLEREGYFFDAHKLAQWLDGGKNKEFNDRVKANINEDHEQRKQKKQEESDRMDTGDYLSMAETLVKVINVVFNMFIAWKKTGK